MARAIGMLRRPVFWWILAATAAGLGLALEAGWLTIASLLSVLIAVAPCLLMCAVGMCMRHGGGTQCHGRPGESSRNTPLLPSGTDNP